MADTFESAFVKIGGDLADLAAALARIPTMIGEALVGAEGQWRDANGRIHDATGKFVAEASIQFGELGKKLTDVGVVISSAISLPIAGAGLAIAKFGGDFEAAMSRVQVLGEVSTAELKKLTDQAIELGIKTPYSAKQAADAMGEFAAQGFKANEIMAAMPGILGLAAAGQVSTGQAAQVTADILRGYGIEASKASMVSDVLAKAASDSSAGVADLGHAFKYIGPVASAAGVSFHESAAALQILADAGIRGEKAGTGLVQMLGDLINPTKKGAEALADLGIKTIDAEGKMLPLSVIVQQFSEKQKAATSETEFLQRAFAIWGQRAADVLPLIAAGGKALEDKARALENATGAAEKMGGALMNNLKGALDQFKGSVETLAITLYDSFGPSIKQAVDWSTKMVNSLIEMAKEFRQQPQWVKDTALAFGAFLAAIGPATAGMGLFLKGLDTIGVKNFADVVDIASIAIKGLGITAAAVAGAWLLAETVSKTSAELSELKANVVALLGPMDGLKASAATMGDNTAKLWAEVKTLVGAKLEALNVAKELKPIWDTHITVFEWLAKNVAALGRELATGFPDAIKTALLPLGFLGRALDDANKLIEQLLTLLGKKTPAMQDVEKSASSLASTLTGKTNAAMMEAALKAGALKTSKDALKTSTDAFSAALEGAHGPLTKHKEKLSEAEKEAKKLQEQIDKNQKSYADFTSTWSGASWDFGQFKLAVDHGLNVDKTLKQISEKISDLTIQWGDKMPAAIKGTIVKLEMARDALEEFKRKADLDALERAFENLNATIIKVPGSLGEVPQPIKDIENAARNIPPVLAECYEGFDHLNTSGVTAGKNIRSIWDDLAEDLTGSIGGFFTDLFENFRQTGLKWESVKDAFLAMLGNMGSAIVKFGTDFIQGVLFKQLSNLLNDVLPALSKAFAKLGGAIPGIGGGGGAAGGAAGAAGGMGGGLLGGGIAAVGAILGGAITGWMLQGDLGKIEINTRGIIVTTMYLCERADEMLSLSEDNLKHLQRLESIEAVLVYAKDMQLVHLQGISDLLRGAAVGGGGTTLLPVLPGVGGGGITIGDIHIYGVAADDPEAFAHTVVGTILDTLATATS